MKTVLVLLIFLAPLGGKGQSLVQLIQQLGLDYQKLAQLKGMLAEMYTAYDEIHSAYEDARGIAAGNFDLHSTFLNALLTVSPVVRDYVKVGRIIDNEASLVAEYKTANGFLTGSGRFSSGELDAAAAFYGNILNGSLRNLEELTDVLTDGTLRMSDAERLSAIDRIDRDMTDRLTVLRNFSDRAGILSGQRGLELNDIKGMKGLYGIGN